MRGKALIRQLYLGDDFQSDGINDGKKRRRCLQGTGVLVNQRQRDHKDTMGHGVELDMSDVITEWRMNAQRNPGNELVGYGINHSYVLVLQGNIRVIGADCNSRVANKDPVIDLVIFDSVRAIIRVELDLSDGVKRALLTNDVDDAVTGITDKDLVKV